MEGLGVRGEVGGRGGRGREVEGGGGRWREGREGRTVSVEWAGYREMLLR